MAGKISPLTWTAPPDGGSPITGYRVLVYEGTNLVGTMTPTTATLQVTASETVARTALIQAKNALGYSRPLQVSIPAGAAGGNPTTPTTPTASTLKITKLSASKATFTLDPLPSGATQYELYAIGYPAQQEDNPPLMDRWDSTGLPHTFDGTGFGLDDYFVDGVRWFMRVYYADIDPIDTAKTPMPAIVAAGGGASTVVGPNTIDQAVLLTGDGSRKYTTVDKSATSNEQSVFGNARKLTWFKFRVVDARTVEISGLPSKLGYSEVPDQADTFAYLRSATSGALIDSTFSAQSFAIVQDDDGGGQGQPYINYLLQPGWYYIAIGGYSAGSGVSGQYLSIRGLDAAPVTNPSSGPSFIDSAVLISTDGVSDYSVSGSKEPSRGEKYVAASTTAFLNTSGRDPLVTWFKFNVPATRTLQINGTPSLLGYTGQDVTSADTNAFLLSAASGNLNDDGIPDGLTLIEYDDNGVTNNTPEFGFSRELSAGWYYLAVGAGTTRTGVSGRKLAIKGLTGAG